MFLVNAAFAVKKIKLSEEVLASELKSAKCEELGRMLGHSVLQSRSALKERLPFLEQPSSLTQYYDSMPPTLAKFFDGMILVLLEKRQQVLARKRKQLNQPVSEVEATAITKLTLLFTSVVAFRHWKIWLTHILASLCQRPKCLRCKSVRPRVQYITHKPTHEEEEILKELENYKDSSVLPGEVVGNLAERLLQYTDHWTCDRIRYRWYNRYRRAKTKRVHFISCLLQQIHYISMATDSRSPS